MILINRLLSILSSLAVFVILELLFFQPNFLIALAIALIAVIVLTVLSLNNWQVKKREFWNFLITPLLFAASGFLLIIFLEGAILSHLMIIFVAIFYGVLLENIFHYLHHPINYQPYSLENIFNYISLITGFFIYTAFFGLVIFLNFPFWILLILGFLVTFVLIYQIIWINKVAVRAKMIYLFVLSFILTEAFWVIHFLPTSYLVSGLILSLFFYLIVNLARIHLKAGLTKEVVRRYLLIAIIVLLLTLTTARWI